MHLECGLPNPLADNWHIKSVVKGIKRGKGTAVQSKPPILPKHLLHIYYMLDLTQLHDLQFWTATLTAFFGLLRIGNITDTRQNSSILRRDVSVTARGLILSVHKSKTIHFKQRVHTVTLPYIPGSVLCPVKPLLQFLARTSQCPDDAPLFSTYNPVKKCVPLTETVFRKRLVKQVKTCNMHLLIALGEEEPLGFFLGVSHLLQLRF